MRSLYNTVEAGHVIDASSQCAKYAIRQIPVYLSYTQTQARPRVATRLERSRIQLNARTPAVPRDVSGRIFSFPSSWYRSGIIRDLDPVLMAYDDKERIDKVSSIVDDEEGQTGGRMGLEWRRRGE